VSEVALQVLHDDLPDGMVEFNDDEIVELQVRREQNVVQQSSQGGNTTHVYVGFERFEFDWQFNVNLGSTLPKLEAIRQLRGTFTIRPFIIEEVTEYTVFWPQQPTLVERWVRGRRAAQWDFETTWIESRIDACLPVGTS